MPPMCGAVGQQVLVATTVRLKIVCAYLLSLWLWQVVGTCAEKNHLRAPFGEVFYLYPKPRYGISHCSLNLSLPRPHAGAQHPRQTSG